MTPRDVADRLRSHEAALGDLGLRSLVLFGSTARGDQTSQSDLDLLYEFDDGSATLDHLLDLQSLLEDVLHRNVDLVPGKYVGSVLRRHIASDLVPVYGEPSGGLP